MTINDTQMMEKRMPLTEIFLRVAIPLIMGLLAWYTTLTVFGTATWYESVISFSKRNCIWNLYFSTNCNRPKAIMDQPEMMSMNMDDPSNSMISESSHAN